MNRLQMSILGLAMFGAAAAIASPAQAQIFELGDQVELDLRPNRDPELRPSLSTDGNTLNLQFEEQPRPETRFRFGEEGFEIRQEQRPARPFLDLSIPINEE
jgi:hypothetical protein